MTAYDEALDYMYNNPEALKLYKEFSGIDEALAKKAMAEFYPRTALDPYRIEGLDSVMADGVEHSFLKEPLNKDQLAQLIQVPAQEVGRRLRPRGANAWPESWSSLRPRRSDS